MVRTKYLVLKGECKNISLPKSSLLNIPQLVCFGNSEHIYKTPDNKNHDATSTKKVSTYVNKDDVSGDKPTSLDSIDNDNCFHLMESSTERMINLQCNSPMLSKCLMSSLSNDDYYNQEIQISKNTSLNLKKYNNKNNLIIPRAKEESNVKKGYHSCQNKDVVGH